MRISRLPLLVLLLLLPCMAWAEEDPAPLATVNGEPITLDELDTQLRVILGAGGPDEQPAIPSPDLVLRRLVQNRLLEQEGYRIEADRLPTVRNQVSDWRKRNAVIALLDSVSATVVPLRQAAIDSMLDRENHLRHYAHILVEEEDLARALRDSLDQGVDFAALARRHSTDGNAGKGGDLGWANEGAYVAAFEEAGRALGIGEISAPVETEFGWHLITLLEERVETAGQNEKMREALAKAFQEENRNLHIRRYVESLWQKYDVQVEAERLASLHFGSEEPGVVEGYRHSDELLAVVPTGRLTVKGLFRAIHYKYFHGLAGNPDADTIRDEMFRDWVDETLLRHEVEVQGLDEDPELLERAERIERELIREQVLGTALAVARQPDREEILEHHRQHPERFLSVPRVKVNSLLLETQEAAVEALALLEQGAQMSWLEKNARGRSDEKSPVPGGWLTLGELGLRPEEAERGKAVGPLEAEEGWLIVEVKAVEKREPLPFERCAEQVLADLQRERSHESLTRAMGRLEEDAEIELVDGAEERIAARIQAVLEARAAQTEATPASHGGMR